MRPTTKKRQITRIAFLQDYTGRRESLLPVLEEVAEKGYQTVAFSALYGAEPVIVKLSERASSLGLEVFLFTCYMRPQWEHLSEHPEQTMVPVDVQYEPGKSALSGPSGCVFNPDFKARYFGFLRELAALPSVSGIWVNDEASMPMLKGCYCPVCEQAHRERFGTAMPRKTTFEADDWKDPQWRRFLAWRLERWNAVHAEMRAVIHAVNPKVSAIFQAGPWEVDLRDNPWYHSVDVSAMVEHLDGLSVDPYHTFGNHPFTPREVFLSEWCRFVAGIVPEDKVAQVIPQGFSHPTFTRPLGAQDGLWTALVPPACGIDMIAPYTYTLQRSSPVQPAYERCFAFDPHFAQTQPLRYAGLVHGAQTEIYVRPLPTRVPNSYDGTRLMPLGESLRNSGTPYSFVADRRLDAENLASLRTLILPEINALSQAQADALRRYLDAGGHAVILGQLGTTDEVGEPVRTPLLEELTGIRVERESGESRHFEFVVDHPAATPFYDLDAEAGQHFRGGAWKPCWELAHCVDAAAPEDAQVLARFTGDKDRPAIVQCRGRGNVLWWAGFPTRTAYNPKFRSGTRNVAFLLFPALVQWSASAPPALRVENWPPETPMKRLRPVDPRFLSAFEFFPLFGDDSALGLITSYFAEPATFPMVLDVPSGRKITAVTELIENQNVPFENEGQTCRIEVNMGFDTPAKLYHFAWA